MADRAEADRLVGIDAILTARFPGTTSGQRAVAAVELDALIVSFTCAACRRLCIYGQTCVCGHLAGQPLGEVACRCQLCHTVRQDDAARAEERRREWNADTHPDQPEET